MQLANFLAGLAATDKLSTASVRVYQSAIQTSIKQMGGRVRGTSTNPSLVRDVVRGIAASQVSRPRRVPSWDLFLVLAYLRGPPFEPLNSLNRELLTLKTTFLIMLASGRRASEVNALSGLPQDIAQERDGTFILSFLPEFRAKNQGAAELSPKIRIPPLCSILAPDDEDRYLCPVRALRHYISFVTPRPGPCRKLFVSVNPNHARDVSKSTLARWVKKVVQLAYEHAGLALPASNAHELRAWSASLAMAQSVAISDILSAAYWKSENTFTNFYLRDVSLTRQDGSYGIGSVVAAQRALTSTHQ